MTMDDRIALELGRALLRALVAEERLAQSLAAAQDEPTEVTEKPKT